MFVIWQCLYVEDMLVWWKLCEYVLVEVIGIYVVVVCVMQCEMVVYVYGIGIVGQVYGNLYVVVICV